MKIYYSNRSLSSSSLSLCETEQLGNVKEIFIFFCFIVTTKVVVTTIFRIFSASEREKKGIKVKSDGNKKKRKKKK